MLLLIFYNLKSFTLSSNPINTGIYSGAYLEDTIIISLLLKYLSDVKSLFIVTSKQDCFLDIYMVNVF